MKRMSTISSVVGILFLLSILAACSSNVKGEKAENDVSDYPNRTITMIVPTAAGGAGDIISRKVAKISEEFFDQTVVVENKAGGSGSIALNDVINKKEDGYTILYHSSTLPLTMASGEIPFKAEDIEPIATLVSNYQVLAVPADGPFKTYEEFVKFAKENPGKLNITGAQYNGANHVVALKIMDGSDISFNYIGYDGGGEAVIRVIGGNADGITSSGDVVQQQVESGELRVLAVSSSERVSLLPDVPTFKELGLTRIDDELIWRAFFMKPGTPSEIKKKVTEVLKKVTETDEFAEYVKMTNQDVYFKSDEELDSIYNTYYTDGVELFGNSK